MTVLSNIFRNTQTPSFKMIFAVLDGYDLASDTMFKFGWRGTVVERRSLAGELFLTCARPAADG